MLYATSCLPTQQRQALQLPHQNYEGALEQRRFAWLDQVKKLCFQHFLIRFYVIKIKFKFLAHSDGKDAMKGEEGGRRGGKMAGQACSGAGVGWAFQSGEGNNYNQFYQIRMLSQYYLIVDTNTLTGDAATHSHPPDSLLYLEEIQKALSLSLNLYALAQQESKVRTLAHPLLRPPPAPTTPRSRLNSAPSEINPISLRCKNITEKNNSLAVGDYFCKTKPESPRAGTLSDQKCADRCQQWLEEGGACAAEGKIKIKKISSSRRSRNRARMTFRRARIGAETARTCLRDAGKMPVGAARIEGELGAQALREKREELMQRWVRSWNPDKDETYIKNREFRMLLRN